MKKIALVILIMPHCLWAEVIDLAKPVTDSVKPDRIYWNFEEGAAGQIAGRIDDASGNDLAGKAQAESDDLMPFYTKGRLGLALQFKSITPAATPTESPKAPLQRLSFRASGSPSGLDLRDGSYTGGIWFRLDKIDAGKAQWASLLNWGVSTASWGLNLIKNENDEWRIRFSEARTKKNFPEFNDQAWHHIGFTIEPEGDRRKVSLWIDGVPLEPPLSIRAQPEPERLVDVLSVGPRSNGFEGAIDEVFITTGIHTFSTPQ